MSISPRIARSAVAAFSLSLLAMAAAQAGQVFTSTNGVAGNLLLVYDHGQDGRFTLHAQLPTGGLGTGGGLGSQGAVTLSSDGRHVFVVNAASNTLSTFTLDHGQPVLASVVDSGGLRPISVTERDGLVVVLNAAGDGNIAAFRNNAGQLQAVPGATRPLSVAASAGAAQVGFSERGDALVVTEKTTNRITTYTVAADGTLGQPTATASAGITPFGFAFDKRDHLIVSEAQGGATNGSTTSSYRFNLRDPAQPLLVSPSVPTTQTAACWVAVSPNGRFAFTANAGSNSVSSYRIAPDGELTLAHAVAGSTGADAGATDLAVSANGRVLYALAPRGLQIVGYTIGSDGHLAATGMAAGLPTGVVGLAAN